VTRTFYKTLLIEYFNKVFFNIQKKTLKNIQIVELWLSYNIVQQKFSKSINAKDLHTLHIKAKDFEQNL